MKCKSRFGILLVVVLSILFVLVGCSQNVSVNEAENTGNEQNDQKKEEKVKVSIGYVQMAISFPFQAALEEGLFEENGIELELYPYADFSALYTAFQGDGIDMAFNAGPASVIDLRANGVPVKLAFMDSLLLNEIFVAKDSPIQDFSELKGKRIGIFGGAAGTSANIFMAIAKGYYGFDPQTEAQVEYGAPGLLASMVERGELDAFLGLEPTSSIQVATGTVRSIGDLATIYTENTGLSLDGAGLAVMDDFAENNKETMEKIISIWYEGIKLLEDPEMWSLLAKKYMDIEDPVVVERLRTQITPTFIMKWTEEEIQQSIETFEFVKEFGGEGFLETLDESTFSRDFVFE